MMLLAVEGGGFFSSSASGYSKGLTLLLLGQKNEDEPMRVAPWTQYQLVDQEIVQLAPGKNRLIRGCASFVCFGRPTVARPDGPSPPKVEPTQNRESHQGPEELDGIKDAARSFDSTVEGDGDGDDDSNRKIGISRKSSLKKSIDIAGAVVDGGGCGNSNMHDLSCERDSEVTCQTERRKVQWTDAIGGELFEIREFEMSDNGSDDEFDHADGKTCACRIM